jgi:putative thioredoxin
VDVTDESFATDVIERSESAPVVVDFWADWCEPCKMLTPVLEEAVEGREVVLAKVDVEANTELARRFQVASIPAVKAFRNGEIVAEFVGVRTRTSVDAFLDELTRPPLSERIEDEELGAPLREGNYEQALEILLSRVEDPDRREEARSTMIDVFNELGQANELSIRYRKRLAAILY